MADTCWTNRRCARLALTLTFVAGPLIGVPEFAAAQTVRDVFQKVAPSVVVKTVAKGSPGEAIGLRGSTMLVHIAGQEVPLGGDIVLSVDGIGVDTANISKIRDRMNRLQAGSPFKVTILRAGQVLELTGKAP